MPDIMVDLETLSVNPNAAIISIGAVAFDPQDEPGTTGEAFFRAVKMESVEKFQVDTLKRHVSPTTVAWWMDQTTEAQRASFANPDAVDTVSMLNDFAEYLIRNSVSGLWGNGASFDNVILANLYEAASRYNYGMATPWHFTKDRCYRTMKNLPDVPTPTGRLGTFHNPLDDARTQAVHLQKIFKFLRTSKNDN